MFNKTLWNCVNGGTQKRHQEIYDLSSKLSFDRKKRMYIIEITYDIKYVINNTEYGDMFTWCIDCKQQSKMFTGIKER